MLLPSAKPKWPVARQSCLSVLLGALSLLQHHVLLALRLKFRPSSRKLSRRQSSRLPDGGKKQIFDLPRFWTASSESQSGSGRLANAKKASIVENTMPPDVRTGLWSNSCRFYLSFALPPSLIISL